MCFVCVLRVVCVACVCCGLLFSVCCVVPVEMYWCMLVCYVRVWSWGRVFCLVNITLFCCLNCTLNFFVCQCTFVHVCVYTFFLVFVLGFRTTQLLDLLGQ